MTVSYVPNYFHLVQYNEYAITYYRAAEYCLPSIFWGIVSDSAGFHLSVVLVLTNFKTVY